MTLRLRIPTREQLFASRWLRPFESTLGAQRLWAWNRRAVARGVAAGLFFGVLIPFIQSPVAAGAAWATRGNLPVAALCTLVTNPFTTAPIYVAAYFLGAKLLAVKSETGLGTAGFSDALGWLMQASAPTALGLFIIALAAAIVGYAAVHLVWQISARRRWRRRRGAALA